MRDELRAIVDDVIKRGDAPYGQREIDCLLALIDDGTVSTKEQLAEYGFEELSPLDQAVYDELSAGGMLHIDGMVETTLPHDQWFDEFLLWLESRGESFGGSYHKSQDCITRRCINFIAAIANHDICRNCEDQIRAREFLKQIDGENT